MADEPANPAKKPGASGSADERESPALFNEGVTDRDFDGEVPRGDAPLADTPAGRQQESAEAMRRLMAGGARPAPRQAATPAAPATPNPATPPASPPRQRMRRFGRGAASGTPPIASTRALQEPPKRRDGVTAWLVMLLCMLAAAPAVLIDLYRPEVTDSGEAKALATSIHSWTRLNSPSAAGENFIESLVPRYNGKRQWRDAPGVVWTQMLAFQLIATKPIKSITDDLVIDAQGQLPLPAPFQPVPAAGLTRRQLDDAIEAQAKDTLKLLDVRVDVAAAAAGGEKPQKAKEERLLVPGDAMHVDITFADPHWRSQVNTIDLIKFGRLCSALLGLITIGAVFWAGHSIAGIRAGVFSALICAANPVFIWHARLASPPIHQAMWAMLSIAAALWAIRPLRASPSVERQFLGWVVCGLSMGGAALTTGPLVVVTVMGPIVLLLLLCPNRRGHLMGLMAAVIIGVLVVVPWTAKIHEADPDAAGTWWREHQPFGFHSLKVLFDNFWSRLLLILAALLPWSVWLFAAIAQPFSTSAMGSRTRLFLGFAWFMAAALIMLMLPASDDLGSLLPLVPAAAVMIGQLFHHYSELAAEARYVRFWRVLRWPHILLLAWISVLAPLVISWPQPFIEKGWFASPFFFDLGWAFSAGLGVVLLILVVLAARVALKQFPGRVLAYTAAWMLLLATVIAIPASRSPHARSLIRKDADVLTKTVHEQPVFVVGFDPSELSPVVLLYAGCEIRRVGAGQIDEVSTKEKKTIYLLSRADAVKPVERAEPVTSLPYTKMQLWRLDQAVSSTATGRRF